MAHRDQDGETSTNDEREFFSSAGGPVLVVTIAAPPPSTKPLNRRACQEREVASHVNNRAASPTSHRRKSAESKTCSTMTRITRPDCRITDRHSQDLTDPV